RQRVCPGGMAAAMLDEYRMIGKCSVEILNREWTPLGRFCVVVFETQHPLAGRGFGSALAQGLQNVSDGTQVTIDHPQVRDASFGGMRVRIDEPWQDRLATEIEFLRIPGGQREHFIIRSNR